MFPPGPEQEVRRLLQCVVRVILKNAKPRLLL